MRRINKILIGLILMAMMFLGVGYSAISNITLDITGTITAEASGGNGAGATPYIPTGFSEVVGTSLETGYTIQDSLENQYVWVEVPQTAEVYPTAGLNLDLDNLTGSALTTAYTTIENDLHTYTATYRNGISFTDTWYSSAQHGFASSDDYNAHKYKMLKSVYQNGGFYVGKYETGIANSYRSASGTPTETPVIQANAYPYNYVTCSQAQTLASSMASGEYTSSLMFGVQWDLVLKYLETKAVENGATLATIQSELNSKSTSWGNYKNNNWNITNTSSKYYYSSAWTTGAYGAKGSTTKSIMLSTGASDTFSKQGIYDLAGNVYEWTLEYTSGTSAPCAIRGGYYYNDGSYCPASFRGDGTTISANRNVGFRVSLF